MTIDRMLGIDYPIIVAPMFLISNIKMIKAALQNGVTAAFPALNYRTENELRNTIEELKNFSNKPFGVNLIVNNSNIKYKSQLDILLDMKVGYIITSLGNPREVIERCKPLGIKVFCDVVNLDYARKIEKLGADAIIAVNSRAGGHAGNIPPEQLITQLKEHCSIPIISAGGISQGKDIKQALDWGASGVSIGTIFIACLEADISLEYKQAIVDYGEKDIVYTNKISGSLLSVINTPYVQQIGLQSNWIERLLNQNRTLKKYVKMLIALRGMNMVKKAAFNATYKSVWCAGPAIEHVKSIRPVSEIIQTLIKEYTSESSNKSFGIANGTTT